MSSRLSAQLGCRKKKRANLIVVKNGDCAAKQRAFDGHNQGRLEIQKPVSAAGDALFNNEEE